MKLKRFATLSVLLIFIVVTTATVEARMRCNPQYLGIYRCNGRNIQQQWQSRNCRARWRTIERCKYGCSDDLTCNEPCEQGYTDNYRCYGKKLQQEYQYKNCRTRWKTVEHCKYGCLDNECNIPPQPLQTPNPTNSDFEIKYYGGANPSDISISTTDGNPLSYPMLVNGTTIYSTNQIKIHANNKIEIVFAMKDFEAIIGTSSACPWSNVIDTEYWWEYQIWKGSWSSWQTVVNPSWNSDYWNKGIWLGWIDIGEEWYMKFRGNIPSNCEGQWNLNNNDNSRYVFLVDD